jgi:peptidyl-prolyl cis-trans isomerase D
LADNLTDRSTNIAGISNARELIKWANEAEQGDISEVFDFESKFVVALLSKVEMKVCKIRDVRTALETVVRAEKKGQMLLDQLSNATNLDQSASEYGVSVKTANNVIFF